MACVPCSTNRGSAQAPSETSQEGIFEVELDLPSLAADLHRDFDEHRKEWWELDAARGLAADLGMGEPARLLRLKVPDERDWFVPKAHETAHAPRLDLA